MPPRSWAELAAVAAVALAAPVVAAGCTPACDTSDDGNAAVRYTEGKITNGVYASSPWHGPLLKFSGGNRYDLVHHFGYTPVSVSCDLSFAEQGVGETEQGDTVAQSAGNSCEYQLVNDELIRIKNDSCSDFWVRVTAYGDPREPEAGTDAAVDVAADVATEAGE